MDLWFLLALEYLKFKVKDILTIETELNYAVLFRKSNSNNDLKFLDEKSNKSL